MLASKYWNLTQIIYIFPANSNNDSHAGILVYGFNMSYLVMKNIYRENVYW